MEEVSGPVVAIALILVRGLRADGLHSRHHGPAVPAVRGHHRRLGDHLRLQRADAQPALSALLLRPKKGKARGPLAQVSSTGSIASSARPPTATWRLPLPHPQMHSALILLLASWCWHLVCRQALPAVSSPRKTKATSTSRSCFRHAASLQRTDEVCGRSRRSWRDTSGRGGLHHGASATTCSARVQNTYSGFFFVTLKDWGERTNPEDEYTRPSSHLNGHCRALPEAWRSRSRRRRSPASAPSGGVHLHSAGPLRQDIVVSSRHNVAKFIAAARQRPELASISTHVPAGVPQVYVDVDRDKVLKQGVELSRASTRPSRPSWAAISSTISTASAGSGRFMCRPRATSAPTRENLGQFYVRNQRRARCRPLTALTSSNP